MHWCMHFQKPVRWSCGQNEISREWKRKEIYVRYGNGSNEKQKKCRWLSTSVCVSVCAQYFQNNINHNSESLLLIAKNQVKKLHNAIRMPYAALSVEYISNLRIIITNERKRTNERAPSPPPPLHTTYIQYVCNSFPFHQTKYGTAFQRWSCFTFSFYT